MDKLQLIDSTVPGDDRKMIADMKSEDTFICPNANCGADVKIEYFTDSRGEHPKYPIICPECKHEYGILFIK